jgi:hypothetical protein
VSRDFVALVRNQPDVNTVIEGMLAYGEELELRETPSGTIQLYDPAACCSSRSRHRPWSRVPGEAERLLGLSVEPPMWWVEVRSSADLPEAVRVARKLVDDLVRWQGGVVWSST